MSRRISQKEGAAPSPAAARDGDRRLGAQSPAQKAAQIIDLMVGRRRFVAGQRLIEADLVQELNVPRAVVREALRLLVGEGVLELIPNRGVRVRAIDKKSLGDMFDVFEAITHAGTVKFASEPLTKPKREILERALKRIMEATELGSPYHMLSAAFDYHYDLCSICGNGYFAVALDRLHVRHYIGQSLFDGFMYNGIDLVLIYSVVTNKLISGDASGALLALRPVEERLAQYVKSNAR